MQLDSRSHRQSGQRDSLKQFRTRIAFQLRVDSEVPINLRTDSSRVGSYYHKQLAQETIRRVADWHADGQPSPS